MGRAGCERSSAWIWFLRPAENFLNTSNFDSSRPPKILFNQNLIEIDAADIPETMVLAAMFDGQVVHVVLYQIGDDDPADTEPFDDLVLKPTIHRRETSVDAYRSWRPLASEFLTHSKTRQSR